MGIKGLLQHVDEALRNVPTPASLRKEFGGQVAAIDAYAWMHRGAFSCGDKIYLKEEGADGFVKFVINNCNYLLDLGIIPVIVFDGRKLPAKRETNAKRRELREKNYEEVEKLFKQGKDRDARYKLRTMVHVTEEMAQQVQAALKDRAIRYVVAPYEADAQMVHMVNVGIADFAISEDADLILFGCQRILFKFDRNKESGVLFERNKLRPRYRDDLTFLRRLCIISGCDYLPNLAGVGLKKAEKFMETVGKSRCGDDGFLRAQLKRLPQALKMNNIKVTDDYIKGFFEADQTFLHQLVYCPLKSAVIPLNKYPDGHTHENFPFAGELLEQELAQAMAFGNVHFETLEIREPRFNPGEKWLLEARKALNQMLKLKETLEREKTSSASVSRSSSQDSSQNSVVSSTSSSISNGKRKKNGQNNQLEQAMKKVCGSSMFSRDGYEDNSPVSSQMIQISKYFKSNGSGDSSQERPDDSDIEAIDEIDNAGEKEKELLMQYLDENL